MRSPALMSSCDTALVVVDIQEKLAATMTVREQVVGNTRRLIQAAGILDVPVLATEQYPKGLGPTVVELADEALAPVEKLTFSCCGEAAFLEALGGRPITKVLLVGMETHVCVQQTALDLLSLDLGVYVPVDAVCSRRKLDWQTALGRMAAAGVVLTTTEAAIFEWTERAGTDVFKQILKLVK